jgi:hypothetical protein
MSCASGSIALVVQSRELRKIVVAARLTPSNAETARNGRRSLAAAIVSYRVRLVTGAGAKIKSGPERQVDMAAPPLRQATTRQIHSALVAVFDQKSDNPPNINTMCPLAKKELGQLGLRASNRQIQDVGDEPGLKLRRRPIGQHKEKTLTGR